MTTLELGLIVATPGALDALRKAQQEAWIFLQRHVDGDWGEVPPEDRQENELSLKEGFRILSAYTLSTGVNYGSSPKRIEAVPRSFYRRSIKEVRPPFRERTQGMKTTTKTFTVYRFDELRADVRSAVLNRERHINVDDSWWYQSMLEDWQATLADMGYEDAKIHFSGFWSQGDGACFEARINLDSWLRHHTTRSFEKLNH